MNNKFILDACCGGKMMWFEKNQPNTIYIDKRKCEKGHVGHPIAKNHEVQPDIIMDNTSMTFKDKQFKLVVFDPPHIVTTSTTGYQMRKYGQLDPKSWKNDLKKSFEECWRVLEDYGILIFKWNEVSIKVSEIIEVLQHNPLFGHKSGKYSKTHWMCFMKIPK